MDGQAKNSGADLVKVTFEPDFIEIYVPVGTTIGKAALAAGTPVETTCGGNGTCGKCRVRVSGQVSEPDASEIKQIGEADLESGYRLACRARVEGETTVTVPGSSHSLVQKILSDAVACDAHVDPKVSKIYVELPEPSLNDERGEFERLAAALTVYDIDAKVGVQTARELPRSLRKSDYKVTAVVVDNEVIAVEPGDTVRKNYGIAYDLGSTTVVGYLIDLNTGRELAVASAMNPQIAYGDDLVSRINFAMTEPEGVSMLRTAALDVLNHVAKLLSELADIELHNVYEVTLVGNTCMSHLFLGLDVSTLGLSPYVPSVCCEMILRADEAGLKVNPGARVHVLPNVAGFVGSDLVAVVIATLRDDDMRTRLAVDVGTNGEMALVHDGRMFACSAAAGPAFEGARISCGMRGAPGAIDSVRITDRVEITTVDNKRPIGLCGSGLVDAIAEMLEAGVIESTGRLISPDEASHLPDDVRERLIETENGVEFVLAYKREAAGGKALTLTQSDVRQLQLGKGSIRAAIETLLRVAGTSSDELSEILLAGAFGNYIRRESAVRIGLIPPIDVEDIVPVGNAAGAGSKLALISVRERERASRVAERIDHIELACHPDYQDELMDKMLFPEPLGKVVAT